jgi:cellulose synthase/poly-beta-1,6-N-acetylglucosamine synthase-like glycosyltransferase
MISFYLIWCLGYLGLMIGLVKKWPKQPNSASSTRIPSSVTVIIPFRNEEKNAEKLISQIRKISKPERQIILVDDQSEDDSFEVFSEAQQEIPQLSVIKSPGIGKKAALEYAIHQASGEIILTTDADCQLPDLWVEKLSAEFNEPTVQLVAGPVIAMSSGLGFFQKFQQLEWASILLLTQFYFSKGSPLMCSGANLAFRKSAFWEVEGYSGTAHLLSGDDEFLLKKVSSKFGSQACVYLPFRENLVKTASHSSWQSLINQRIRWAGKWSVHRSVSHGFAAAFSFFIQFVWLGSIWFFSQNLTCLIFLSLIWMVKILSERMALGRVMGSLSVPVSFGDFVLTSLVHPVYVIWVGLGSVRGKFIWKGRTN